MSIWRIKFQWWPEKNTEFMASKPVQKENHQNKLKASCYFKIKLSIHLPYNTLGNHTPKYLFTQVKWKLMLTKKSIHKYL